VDRLLRREDCAASPVRSPADRESFGFAAGGLVSSCVLLLGVVVATQVV
jgi:hypothetical protein